MTLSLDLKLPRHFELLAWLENQLVQLGLQNLPYESQPKINSRHYPPTALIHFTSSSVDYLSRHSASFVWFKSRIFQSCKVRLVLLGSDYMFLDLQHTRQYLKSLLPMFNQKCMSSSKPIALLVNFILGFTFFINIHPCISTLNSLPVANSIFTPVT